MNCRACNLRITGDGSDDHGCWRCEECGCLHCDDKPCECSEAWLDELCVEEGSEFIEYEIDDIPALDAAGAEPTRHWPLPKCPPARVRVAGQAGEVTGMEAEGERRQR